MLEITPAEKF